MARTYSDETKAAVMAALLAGQSVSSVAKEYDIPKGTISNWKTRRLRGVSQNGTQKRSLDDLLVQYVEENLITLRTQAEVFRDEKWLKRQTASEAAVLHGVLADKTVRLLEAFGATTDAADEET